MNTLTVNNNYFYKPVKTYVNAGLYSFVFYHKLTLLEPYKRYKKSYGINRIEDFALRKQAAVVMANTINEALSEGWNPAGAKEIKINNDQFALLSDLLKKSLTLILNKTAKTRTINSYKSLFNQFENYLKKNNKYYILPNEFTKLNALDYQQHLLGQKLANKTINTKTEFAYSLFNTLVKIDVIPSNPFSSVDRLKIKESEKNKIFTKEEIETIKNYCLKNAPELWQYILFIYYCFMRPASIACIVKEDIDLENGWIYIAGENHKNGKNAVKELLPVHIEYLKPFLKNIPKGAYLFGRDMKFVFKKVPPTRFAEYWRKHIIDALGIDKTAYGLKNTGAADFLKNNTGNENLKWLQMQMSHADLQTTSIYTNKLKVIKLSSTNNVPII